MVLNRIIISLFLFFSVCSNACNGNQYYPSDHPLWIPGIGYVLQEKVLIKNQPYFEEHDNNFKPSDEKYKTRLCMHHERFTKGQNSRDCDRGENCIFAHGEHELWNSRFKTKMCKNQIRFLNNETDEPCKYGKRCCFAHSIEELRWVK